MGKCNCCCCFGWFSGFFATPAIMHLIRIIAKWDVALNGNPIDIKTSWVIFGITAGLSVIFGIIGCKKHKEGASGATC